MTKLAPEWVRAGDPVIRSPARYRWTTAPAITSHVKKFVPMTCDEPVAPVEPDHNVSVPDMVDINTDEQCVHAPIRPGRNIKPPSWQNDYVMG